MDAIKLSASTAKTVFPNISSNQMPEAVEGVSSVLISSGNVSESNYLKADREKAIEELNKAIKAIQGPQRTLEFSVHEETHAVMIKVMNKETGELIREVPPEKLLDMAAKMMEFAGLIVDKKI